MDNKLAEYIAFVRSKGASDESIRAHLMKFGYPQAMIDEHLMIFIEPDRSRDKTSEAAKPLLGKMPVFPILIAILAIVFLATLILGLAGSRPTGFLLSRQSCDSQLRIFEQDGKPMVCVFKDFSKIEVALENRGIKRIDNISVMIWGDKDFAFDLGELSPNMTMVKLIDYHEKPSSIEFKPVIEGKNCRAIIASNITVC